MRNRTSTLLRPCLLGLLLGVPEVVQGTVIDYNTTIDYDIYVLSVIRGLNPNPPTIVYIVEGASIGSSWGGHLEAHDDSILNIEGGTIQDSLYVYDHSTVNMSGGSAPNLTYVYDHGTLNVSGGYAGWYLDVHDFGTLNFSGGRVGQGLYAWDSSTVDFSGSAIIEGGLSACDSSTVTLRGGTVLGAGASDSSVLNVYGGWIGDWHGRGSLAASGSSTVNIYGYDLLLTEDPGPRYDFTLTGTLADGNPLDVGVDWRDDAQIILHQVPEPSALVLLLTTLGGISAYRWCRKPRLA